MAIMIPRVPNDFSPESQEGAIFGALELLGDDYYVFHSMRITGVQEGRISDSEIDFVIFNRKKGIICLEAKAGRVKYERGRWYYSSDKKMKHGGPFKQASDNKYRLIGCVRDSKLSFLLGKCKFFHGVFFPSVTDAALRKMYMPPECDKNIVLTKEALDVPEKYLERIYSLDVPGRVKTSMSENEAGRLVKEVLCPRFDVFPSVSFENDVRKTVFHRFLREQTNILNFLGEQRTAVISGMAGTGKTMIALEKARRHAADRERVLFLCYNSALCGYLRENYKDGYIDYYTIAAFACKTCGTDSPDYGKLKGLLEDMFFGGKFPYRHIIVDEGQDFGTEDIEETDILQRLKEMAEADEEGKMTFYVFYDKLQLVQSKSVPACISDADCRLTLYKNCRNTENIARASICPLGIKKPPMIDGCVKGAPAKIRFCDSRLDAAARLDDLLKTLRAEGYDDIVLLTCKTEKTSFLADSRKYGRYGKHLFTTCRKFKGLEADAVILLDVDRDVFLRDNVLLYYVGASRARLRLDVFASLSDEDCEKILAERFGAEGKIKNPRRELASKLSAL